VCVVLATSKRRFRLTSDRIQHTEVSRPRTKHHHTKEYLFRTTSERHLETIQREKHLTTQQDNMLRFILIPKKLSKITDRIKQHITPQSASFPSQQRSILHLELKSMLNFNFKFWQTHYEHINCTHLILQRRKSTKTAR